MIPLVGAGGNAELRLAQPCGPSGVPASVDARVEPPGLVVPCIDNSVGCMTKFI